MYVYGVKLLQCFWVILWITCETTSYLESAEAGNILEDGKVVEHLKCAKNCCSQIINSQIKLELPFPTVKRLYL